MWPWVRLAPRVLARIAADRIRRAISMVMLSSGMGWHGYPISPPKVPFPPHKSRDKVRRQPAWGLN